MAIGKIMQAFLLLKKVFLWLEWSLKPIILATLEADIEWIIVQGQPDAKIHKLPTQPMVGQSGSHLSSPAL
jgi:hypothetical protein